MLKIDQYYNFEFIYIFIILFKIKVVRWFCILFLLPFGLLSQDYPVELRIQAGHANKVTVVKFSPDAKFLASGSYDRNVILWDVQTGRELRRYQTAGYPITLDISTDDSLILTNSDQGVTQVWEIQTGKLVKELGGKDLYIKVAKFLPGSNGYASTIILTWSGGRGF